MDDLKIYEKCYLKHTRGTKFYEMFIFYYSQDEACLIRRYGPVNQKGVCIFTVGTLKECRDEMQTVLKSKTKTDASGNCYELATPWGIQSPLWWCEKSGSLPPEKVLASASEVMRPEAAYKDFVHFVTNTAAESEVVEEGLEVEPVARPDDANWGSW